MPAPRTPRPPMPKLPPFALMNEPDPPRKTRPEHVAIFLVLFALPVYLLHGHLLRLPYFWDEAGQFVPSALDVARHGWLVAHSAVPNVHPPAVAVYLAIWYKLFGASILITRVAMLLVACVGMLATFLLGIELTRGCEGAPAFLPPFLLLVSPLFYMQSMLAQLDMPAMTLTLVVLWLYVKRHYAWAAVVCVLLVLVKETGIVTPFACFALLAWRKDYRRAAYFTASAAALGIWLVVLHAKTGHWLGDAEFARYNVNYALQPVRMATAFGRRFFYLFVAEFRWIGTAVLLMAARSSKVFRNEGWLVTTVAGVLTIIVVSVFGGAELERYLLPVLPLFYIAVAVGLSHLTNRLAAMGAATGLLLGLSVSVFWNPPYPFPFENNYAMVDFVNLQRAASSYVSAELADRRVATAWPYTAGLRNPDLGFVPRRGLNVVETHDLHFASIRALPAGTFDALVVYTREWPPHGGVTSIAAIQSFLRRFYDWAPDINPDECAALGLEQKISWRVRGQTVSIYVRNDR